jgi:hypothetical protein
MQQKIFENLYIHLIDILKKNECDGMNEINKNTKSFK